MLGYSKVRYLPHVGDQYNISGSQAGTEVRAEPSSLRVPKEKFTGFKAGNYPYNRAAADTLLAKAKQQGALRRAVIPALKTAGVDISASMISTMVLYFASARLMSQQGIMSGIEAICTHPQLKENFARNICTPENMSSTMSHFSEELQQPAKLVVASALTTGMSRLAGMVKDMLTAFTFPLKGEGREALVMLEAVKLMRNKVKDILPILAPNIRNAFAERLDALEILLQSTDSYSALRLQPDWMKREFEKLVALLSLPPGTTDVYQHGLNGDPTIAAEIDQKQRELADSYDEPVRSQLNDFMNQARYFYSNPDGAQVPALFLQGPPGTGKTFAAKMMADSVFKAQLITIPMHKLAEYLDWSDGFQIPRPDDNKPLLEPVGMAWQKLISEVEGNAMWFIDEVDFESNPKHQVLIEPIKMWLNQENTDFPKLQQLGVSPNIRGPVIFASNYKLDDVRYRAFVDRLTHVVQFPHWSAEKMKDRAESYLQHKIGKMTNHHKEDAIVTTKTKAEELLPSVLELARRFSPEDITLRDIYRTIDDIVYKLAIAADTGNAVDDNTLMNNIEKSYNSKASSKAMPSVASVPTRKIPRVTAAHLDQFLANASLVEPLDPPGTLASEPSGI